MQTLLKYKDHFELKKGKGQPRILSEREERKLVPRVKENLHCSAPQLAAEIRHESGQNVSAEAARKVMRVQ